MTKAVLVEEVAQVTDLTKKHAEVIVETVFRSIIDALHRGEKIELRGFGSFRLRQREPRRGRNPKTGDRVDVPPKKVPYFKPGKELKELINRDPDRVARPDAAAAPGTAPAPARAVAAGGRYRQRIPESGSHRARVGAAARAARRTPGGGSPPSGLAPLIRCLP